jgi:regulatory protein
MTKPQKPAPSRQYLAQKRVMDLISRRNYSTTELKQRLRDQAFTQHEIETALKMAQENKWLAAPEEMSHDLAQKLHLKNKGILFINNILQEKGLPSISRDENLELEKAESLVKTKYSQFPDFSEQEKLKVMRFLISRGFDSSTIEKVIHVEEF